MLTIELQNNIDKKWEACWPINVLRPLVILDLVSYLLFVKKIGESKLIAAWQNQASANTFTHIRDKSELTWSSFKDLDAQGMHELFVREKGLLDLIKNYGGANLQYSLFVKEPLLLTPTVKLLANMVDVVKIMEAEDNQTRAAIFQYLLYKAEIAGQKGQVYAPDYIVKLIVALMRPAPDDVIGDPCAGNGSLLVNSAMYIAGNNPPAVANYQNVSATNIKGIEADLIQLRIGAMNMILHGIEDPHLKSLKVVNKTNLNIREQPTLILSNLFFDGTEDVMAVEANASPTKINRPETGFLNLILKSLKTGGRAAVIIREVILYDHRIEVKTIRQQIIDDHKLEAIISLPGKTGSLFSGACIVIFTKQVTNIGDKVWFYKMEREKQLSSKEKADLMDTGSKNFSGFAESYNDVLDILTRWEMEKSKPEEETDKSFYVPVDQIRNNNYNLNATEYRRAGKNPELYISLAAGAIEKENISRLPPKNFSQPGIETVKPVVQTSSIKRTLSVGMAALIISGIAIFAFYSSISTSKNGKVTYSTTKNNALQGANTAGSAHQEISVVSTSREAGAKRSKEIVKDFTEQKNDTTAIKQAQKKYRGLSAGVIDKGKPGLKINTSDILNADATRRISGSAVVKDVAKEQFIVTVKAYFHSMPNERTRRNIYINHWSNSVLRPIDDKNGFIYIVYTDPLGQTTRGWLNKNDLKQVP